MKHAPALPSSFVGRHQLWLLCWVIGTELSSIQVVPQGLCENVVVGGRPQLSPDAICSGFPQRLHLSRDVAVFPGCDLLGPDWLRPVLDLVEGTEALLQPHNDRWGHLKMSSDFSYRYTSLGMCRGPFLCQPGSVFIIQPSIVPWCGQTLANMG